MAVDASRSSVAAPSSAAAPGMPGRPNTPPGLATSTKCTATFALRAAWTNERNSEIFGSMMNPSDTNRSVFLPRPLTNACERRSKAPKDVRILVCASAYTCRALA